MTGMVRLMRRGALELELTRLFVVLTAEATSPGHPAHEWAIRRNEGTMRLVVAALHGAQERELLKADFDVQVVATNLLAAMDGLQLRYLLMAEEFRIDEAFAALAGQMLADLAFDSAWARATIRAWRLQHAPR